MDCMGVWIWILAALTRLGRMSLLTGQISFLKVLLAAIFLGRLFTLLSLLKVLFTVVVAGGGHDVVVWYQACFLPVF